MADHPGIDMNGAVFFSSKYGSTAQYASWIGEATGLPVFDVDETDASPSEYDFVVLGSPVIYHKLWFHKWVKRSLASLLDRPVILFSVSGAGAGPKLDEWIARSMPEPLIRHAEHFALLGRQNRNELTWFDRMMLLVGGLMNPDPQASREERKGFDYMDRASIGPIVEAVERLATGGSSSPVDGSERPDRARVVRRQDHETG